MSSKVILPPAQLVSTLGGQCALYSRGTPARDRTNQDAVAIVPLALDCGAIIIADGLGGLHSGEVAANMAVSTVCRTIYGLESGRDEFAPQTSEGIVELLERSKAAGGIDPQDREILSRALRVAILDGLENANERVLSESRGSATTIAVLQIVADEVRSYHVGDSVTLLCGQRGKLKFQTVGHSPVGLAVEAGILDEDEALHHEDRHIVSNVIGCPEMKVELGPTLHMAPRDTVLMATDGLFDNLRVSEIVDCVRKGPLREAVANLARDATQRMLKSEPGHPSKPDDLTIVAFRRHC